MRTCLAWSYCTTSTFLWPPGPGPAGPAAASLPGAGRDSGAPLLVICEKKIITIIMRLLMSPTPPSPPRAAGHATLSLSEPLPTVAACRRSPTVAACLPCCLPASLPACLLLWGPHIKSCMLI